MTLILNAIGLIACISSDSISLNGVLEKYWQKEFAYGTPQEVQEAKTWPERVYLATYPRSGNHWMRHLIEEATGIITSSVYTDVHDLETAFPWGGYCKPGGYGGGCAYPAFGEIAVVKTHFPFIYSSRFDRLPYSSAIRIIRHPVDSFYSLYLFMRHYPGSRIPREKLLFFIKTWRRFQEYWNHAENVLTIRYEDIYTAPPAYLSLVLEKIGYSATQEGIQRAVAKFPPAVNFFKHKKHFTEDDLALIKTELADLMQMYGYEIDKIIPLEELSHSK